MMGSPNIPVLAIDGGGTRCRFALEQPAERVVVETGPANAHTDFNGTVSQLKSGIKSLAERAETPAAARCALR